MSQNQPNHRPIQDKLGMAYSILVVATTLVWFFYSLSAQQGPRLMIAAGIVLLVLLVPLVKRPRKRK